MKGRRLRAICTAALGAALAFALRDATPARAQTAAIDMEIANEFLMLELAGWRLPAPTEDCLTGLSLRRLEPMAFGAEDLVDQPELVDPPGPFFRVTRVEIDPADRRRRIVTFDWLLPRDGGAPRAVRDSFVFTLSGAAGGPAMQREPEHMVIRSECFDG